MPRPFWRPSREADVGVNLLFAINPVHDIEVTHLVLLGRPHEGLPVPGVDHGAPGGHTVPLAQAEIRVCDWVKHLRLLRVSFPDKSPGVAFIHLPAGNNFP